jgi:3-oxoacyl-[acyl-carrier protein] reductase
MTSNPQPAIGDGSGPLAGQVALVTGASRGIGSAIAQELAASGAEVVVNYAQSPDAAALVVEGILQAGGSAWAHRANVAEEAEVEAMVQEIVGRRGRIDVLVNNAGITRDGLLMRMKTADWQSVIDLNLTGCFLTTRAVSKLMLKARRGRIINITSVVALMGHAGQANYSAAKAGLIGLTRSNAAEFASRGVTVNAVAPGFIASDMTANLDQEPILKAIPLGRMGLPEEVAGAVRFLAADPAAAYITGQVLQVDGGMVMR